MIAVDTNILVRLVVNDDDAQGGKARALFDAAAERRERVWIADTVLVELAWTLARAYERSREDIAKVMRALAGNATVALESPAALEAAMRDYEGGPADFADCLLCAKAAIVGCDGIATFDRGMRTLPGVRVL